MKNRNNNLRLAVLITVLSALGLAFNNCGQMKAVGEDSAGLSSKGLSKIPFGEEHPSILIAPFSKLYSLQIFEAIAKQRTISFAIDHTAFPAGTQIIWDHQLNDGGQFCQQTSDVNDWIIHYDCPVEGSLILDVVAVLPDNSKKRFVAQVDVLKEPGLIPGDDEPGPEEETGAGLYAEHCASCHFSLPSSVKKGRSALQIQNAISSNTGGMRTLSGLTAEQIQKIADALAQ